MSDDVELWKRRYWQLAEEMRGTDWMLLVNEEPKFQRWFEEAREKVVIRVHSADAPSPPERRHREPEL